MRRRYIPLFVTKTSTGADSSALGSNNNPHMFGDLASAQSACEAHGYGCAGVTAAVDTACGTYQWYNTAQTAPSGTDCTRSGCVRA